MLTKADDYPIHQTADPIAIAGTDRNFYDRYFFNGYTADGSIFFAAALGVYPHLNILDGAFCVVRDGVQYNLHASRHLDMERMDTTVGPLAIDVLEPLRRLRIRVGENASGLSADLTFAARAPAIKEPRFTWRIGPRTVFDYTRLTQNGTYTGWVAVQGDRTDVQPERVMGTRDRSWGVRPVGQPDPQPYVPPLLPQFYWLWAPLNFPDRITLFHRNDDEHGTPWNIAAAMCGLGDAAPERMVRCHSTLRFRTGSRHAAAATLVFEHATGGESRLELTPRWSFYMQGLGYGHPEWSHGLNHGGLAVGHDALRLDEVATYAPPFLHVQAFVTADLTLPDGARRHGAGVLEQLILGAHAPSGFTEILDAAP